MFVPKLFPSFGVNPCYEAMNWAHLRCPQVLPITPFRDNFRLAASGVDGIFANTRAFIGSCPTAPKPPTWLLGSVPLGLLMQ